MSRLRDLISGFVHDGAKVVQFSNYIPRNKANDNKEIVFLIENKKALVCGSTQGIGKATAIANAERSVCVVLDSGGIECWGYNGNGQLGDGTITTNCTTPKYITKLTI